MSIMVTGLSEDAFEQARKYRYDAALDYVKDHSPDRNPASAFGVLRYSVLRAHEHLARGDDDYALIELAAAIGALDGVDIAIYRRVRAPEPLDTRAVIP